jgi:hypothetical protein
MKRVALLVRMLCIACVTAIAAADRPNIVYILADDKVLKCDPDLWQNS